MARVAFWQTKVLSTWKRFDAQLRILLCVHDGGDGNTKVGGRSPEICAVTTAVSIVPPNRFAPARMGASIFVHVEMQRSGLAAVRRYAGLTGRAEVIRVRI